MCVGMQGDTESNADGLDIGVRLAGVGGTTERHNNKHRQPEARASMKRLANTAPNKPTVSWRALADSARMAWILGAPTPAPSRSSWRRAIHGVICHAVTEASLCLQ